MTLREGDLVALVGPNDHGELARVASHGSGINVAETWAPHEDEKRVRALQRGILGGRVIADGYVLVGLMHNGRRTWISTKREWVQALEWAP